MIHGHTPVNYIVAARPPRAMDEGPLKWLLS
jgi:hypothetical protein